MALAALALAAALPAAAPAAEAVGTLSWLKGSVTLTREGKTTAAVPGCEVCIRDTLRAGPDSGAEVILKDQSVVKLAAGASLEITDYLYAPDQAKRSALLTLAAGKARFVANDLKEFKEKGFQVRSATAIIGTRGTDFVVWVAPDGATSALAIERVVVVAGREKPRETVTIAPNQVSEVRPGALPSAARTATAAERSAFLRELDQFMSDELKKGPAKIQGGSG